MGGFIRLDLNAVAVLSVDLIVQCREYLILCSPYCTKNALCVIQKPLLNYVRNVWFLLTLIVPYRSRSLSVTLIVHSRGLSYLLFHVQSLWTSIAFIENSKDCEAFSSPVLFDVQIGGVLLKLVHTEFAAAAVHSNQSTSNFNWFN